jgi:glycosyltransferase involved in cell wall biosynthesis
MRYGCELSTRAELVELLCERRAEFQAALDEVEGRAEWTIRVLLKGTAASAPKDVGPGAGPSSGKAYLATRRAWYADQDHQWNEAAAVTRRIENAFDRLLLRCVTEPPCAGREQLLTLHFLVHEKDQERFRRAFRRLEKSAPQKLLLTGPWPPYNFTSCPPASGGQSRRKE